MRAAPILRWLATLVLAVGCATTASDVPDYASVPAWRTRAIPEARGDVRGAVGGKREALRYAGWSKTDFGRFRTYAYTDARSDLPVQRATMPVGVTGDARKGRALFLSRSKGPCTGCHLIPGDDVWPAGNVGPDLSTIADRRLTDDYLYQQIHDPRVVFPQTSMPPWGAVGAFTPEEIVHLVAFMQTLKGPAPAEKDPDRNPETRRKPVGFGDNLDPTNNPAVLLAEDAEAQWRAKGTAGKACADCHAGGPAIAMKGVATRYPRFLAKYGRVMSIEDFLTVHGPETTGAPFAAESESNLSMTVLVKMASNGLPIAVDTESAEARAALARGRASFYRRVGERNHACADCHTPEKGANKFLGGRYARRRHHGPDPALPDLAHEPDPGRGTCASACSGA